MELDDEEREAEEALREAQLKQTRLWLRQVEEENEVKLRERLNEQRKMQQEHFKKLDIRDEYLPPNLAFANLPSGKSMVKRNEANGPQSPQQQQMQQPHHPHFNLAYNNNNSQQMTPQQQMQMEENELRQRQSQKWAQNVHQNDIASSPASLHSIHSAHHAVSPQLSPKRSGGGHKDRSCCSSCGRMSKWFLLLVLHDLGLVLLCLWIYNRHDSNEIPWKWLGFTDED